MMNEIIGAWFTNCSHRRVLIIDLRQLLVIEMGMALCFYLRADWMRGYFDPLEIPLGVITDVHVPIITHIHERNYDWKQFVLFFPHIVPDILHVIADGSPNTIAENSHFFSASWKVMYYISSGRMYELICFPQSYEKRKQYTVVAHRCIRVSSIICI